MRTLMRSTSAAALTALLLTSGAGVAAPSTPGAVEEGDVLVYQLPAGVVSRGSAASAWAASPLSAHRIENGTVIYWAVRSLHDQAWTPHTAVRWGPHWADERNSLAATRMRVPGSDRVHHPLSDGSSCLCTGQDGQRAEADETVVVYGVYPQVPSEVRAVDLDVSGNSDWVRRIPLTDDLPDPLVDARAVVLGEGFPRPPEVGSAAMTVEEQDFPQMLQILRRIESSDGLTGRTLSDDYTQIDISAEVFFDRNEYELTADSRGVLADLAGEIEAAQAGEITVVGHTDIVGTRRENQVLSERRAASVAEALQELLPDVSVTSEGRSYDEPIATNSTEEGMAKNRRVSITYLGAEQ